MTAGVFASEGSFSILNSQFSIGFPQNTAKNRCFFDGKKNRLGSFSGLTRRFDHRNDM
jgi:hypothetical protein